MERYLHSIVEKDKKVNRYIMKNLKKNIKEVQLAKQKVGTILKTKILEESKYKN